MSAFPGRIVMPKAPKAARVFENKRQKKLKTKKDTDNYIGYEASDAHTEAGYSLMNNFEAAAKGAVLDIAGDDDASARAKKNQVSIIEDMISILYHQISSKYALHPFRCGGTPRRRSTSAPTPTTRRRSRRRAAFGSPPPTRATDTPSGRRGAS